MPEGPEVKRMSINISERIEGDKITEALVLGGKWIKNPPANINEFQKNLPSKVQNISAKGKSIQIYLENGWTIWNTLGMSGGWKDNQGKHSHFSILTDKGKKIWFDDTRRFGNLIFIKDQKDVQGRLNKIGPDLLNEDVSFDTFSNIIKRRGSKPISKVLMDQSMISGIGNYIKCEVLYRSKISPWRLCQDITDEEMQDLYKYSLLVIKKSFDQGGATLSTYTDMDGKKGEFVFFFMVYMKKNCPLGYDVKREITPDGRTTHWVPEVQK